MEQQADAGFLRHRVEHRLQHLRVVADAVHPVARGHGEAGMPVAGAEFDQARDNLLRDAADDAAAAFGLPADELADGGGRGRATQEAETFHKQCRRAGARGGDGGHRAAHPTARHQNIRIQPH